MKILLSKLFIRVLFIFTLMGAVFATVRITPVSSDNGFCNPVTDPSTAVVIDGSASTPDLQFNLRTFSSNPALQPANCILPLTTPAPDRISTPQFAIPSYIELKSLHYDQLKNGGNYMKIPAMTGTVTQGDFNQKMQTNPNQNLIFWVQNSSAQINGNLNPPRYNGTAIIFVDNDLNISNDITYGDPSDPDSQNQGLVFIVNGNINIDPVVKKINAVLVAYNGFCSAYSFASTSCSTTDAPQLVINGSVIFLNSSTGPRFVRNYAGNNNIDPAEKIIYQPKYLINLRGIFSQDITIRTELN